MANPKYPLIFDNTMRCSFKDCPRKFSWWWQGYDYETIPGYFAFGQVWGIVKQEWYTNGGHLAEPHSPEWTAIAITSLNTGLMHWRSLNSSAEEKKPNDPDTLIALWNLYLEDYPNESIEMIAPEVGFTFPLATIARREVSLGGALDGYVRQEGIGIFALEEKTTGMYLSDNFLAGYTYSPQITTYVWQGRKLTGSEFQGVLVSIATKRITKAGKTPQFARTFQNRSENDLEEFERDFIKDIGEMYECIDNNYFPKTTNSINCTGGIGRAPCLFRGLCASGIPYKDLDPLAFPFIILKEDYEWLPWKRNEDKKEIPHEK